MPEISLTEFVDFALKSGTPQFTAVKEIKRAHEVGYHPTRDFYLKMRDGIVEMHRDNAPKSALDGLVRGIRDKNKQKLYPVLAEGYRKFLGRKAISWFEPPRCNWSFGGLVVRVNPELGLSFDGQDHIIKLYFKEDKLLKRGIEHVNYLILSALGSNAGQQCRHSRCPQWQAYRRRTTESFAGSDARGASAFLLPHVQRSLDSGFGFHITSHD